jgi:acetolactate synthase regulatory subunit
VNKEDITMVERIRARFNGDSDGVFKALSLLRRKSFEVLQVELLKHPHANYCDLNLTAQRLHPSNPYTLKALMEKLVDFEVITHE